MPRWTWVWAVCAGLGASAVQAREDEAREPGQCAFVRGMAQVESSLQSAPQLFANVGVVNAGDAAGGIALPLGQPTPRLSVGVDYDFVGLYRGRALRQRAEAECARYRALSGLRQGLMSARDVGAEAALAARSRLLESALPEAEQLLAVLDADMKSGVATLSELNVLRLRLDALRALAFETRREHDRLAALPHPEARPLARWLEELRAADDAVEDWQRGLRTASAWTVRVRGGYDELFRTPREVPVSGALTLTYNLGGLRQGEANTRARDGRRRALDEEVEGVSQQAALLVRELEATHAAERGRLTEVELLVGDLEAQLREVQALETVKVRRYRDYLLLELIRLRAEHAWLGAHVEEVGRFLAREHP